MGTFFYLTTILFFILLCIVLCFVVMIQESKSSGLGASFGGEASESLFGTSTADVLKKVTAWLGAAFLVTCMLLSFWTTALGHSRAGPTAEIPQVEGLEK